MSILLLAIVVFAWGFSWYAITLQVAEASALLSLTYRFILAAMVMCAGLLITRKWKAIPWRDQPWLIALGFCLFSMNFLSFYLAAHFLTSGLMSVIFSTAAIFGALNTWLILRRPLELRVLVAAFVGTVGLYLLLYPNIHGEKSATTAIWTIGLPFVGTYLFSLGNLISTRLTISYSLPNVIGQGMVWGAIILMLFCLIFEEQWAFPQSTLFWVGVIYLALVSSLLAFLTYLALVNRVGPARASYTTVLFPIVAMLVSTVAEGYVWTPVAMLGLGMALGGTYLIFSKPRKNSKIA
jgi:drug/metabolite transporter (DMT)-like permease